MIHPIGLYDHIYEVKSVYAVPPVPIPHHYEEPLRGHEPLSLLRRRPAYHSEESAEASLGNLVDVVC